MLFIAAAKRGATTRRYEQGESFSKAGVVVTQSALIVIEEWRAGRVLLVLHLDVIVVLWDLLELRQTHQLQLINCKVTVA